MTATSRTAVLIVGAGPTGLALANVLSRYHVEYRIIDKATAVSPYSKALGMQAGTLEAIGDMMGEAVVNKMVAAGRPVRHANYHVLGQGAVRIDISHIEGAHSYVLILPQSETEKHLAAPIAAKLERGRELTTATRTPDGVVCTIVDQSGAAETCAADYVVGCDGAHSAIRHAANIKFSGNEYRGDFVLADVRVRWPFDTDGVHIFLADAGVAAMFPLPTPEHYRVMLIESHHAEKGTPAPPLSAVAAQLSALSGAQVELDDCTWLTRFSLHHRMASAFQAGRLFLCGDAAHIHSPVGGQGMNTGIQDAFNLGHKLARVLKDRAPAAILGDYERERMPVARDVVRSTDLIFRQLVASSSPLAKLVRSRVVPVLARLPIVQRTATRTMSEVKIARREIAERAARPVKNLA